MPPPTGFDIKPLLVFTDEKRLPQADTCSMRFTVWRNYTSYDSFKEDMDFSIPNSQGFGLV